jgi:hypothetical protein
LLPAIPSLNVSAAMRIHLLFLMSASQLHHKPLRLLRLIPPLIIVIIPASFVLSASHNDLYSFHLHLKLITDSIEVRTQADCRRICIVVFVVTSSSQS